MKLMLMAASMKKESLNKKLISIADRLLKQQGHESHLYQFEDFVMPLYHGDLETKEGLPKATTDFISHMQDHDALIISSPEYNFSTPGTLKNMIDWVSRKSPMPWTKQIVLLMSASPALAGGHRGLWQTRIPLEGCGAFVYPDMFALSAAHTAFNEDGSLKDESLTKRLENTLKEFTVFVKNNKIIS
ncbi:MAG: NAD(P)H-dependent oxidoreductase [Proteobacteria bacterium]|nr:NAD(P)H-dependent oxidoreductase [Pseudomonadota bacterium]